MLAVETSEWLHINFAKKAYTASNQRDYSIQMTRWLQCQEAVIWFSSFLTWCNGNNHPVPHPADDCSRSDESNAPPVHVTELLNYTMPRDFTARIYLHLQCNNGPCTPPIITTMWGVPWFPNGAVNPCWVQGCVMTETDVFYLNRHPWHYYMQGSDYFRGGGVGGWYCLMVGVTRSTMDIDAMQNNHTQNLFPHPRGFQLDHGQCWDMFVRKAGDALWMMQYKVVYYNAVVTTVYDKDYVI
ncbi:hypothetical protein EDD16DRAFT_1527107 [Pisolithus croceorrhizus]|nr:hypothetical protein EDD16DRAFT_1527107 [Pisolithus croceorrhizus]KAI6102771.1 hypothetical protein EV401DRAFT_1893781 [Pisolithus croceorrhizus]